MPDQPSPHQFGVLVVEDEPQVLSMLTQHLRSLGAATFPAAGCAEAERLLRSHSGEIDAAVIDLCMPVADGLETRGVLDAVKPGLPCCLMSATGVGDATLPPGFRLALDKPITTGSLRACLDALARVEPDACAPLVLLVEDDEPLRLLFRRQLERGGYRVAEAADGRDGLVVAAESRPDVLVCDLLLLEREGLGLIGELQALAPSIRVVVMSDDSQARGDFLCEVSAIGPTVSLEKPFGRTELLGAVRRAVGR